MAMDFQTFAMKADLTDDKYPYADLTITSKGLIKWGFWLSVVAGSAKYTAKALLEYIAQQNIQNAQNATNTAETATSVEAVSSFFPKINFVEYIIKFYDFIDMIFPYCYWMFIIGIILWVFSVIRRNQSFERNVISNDAIAKRLKRDMLESLSIEDKLVDLRRNLNPSDGKAKEKDLKARIEEETLRAIKEAKVYVNTRETLDGGIVRQQYRIVIKLPTRLETRNSIKKFTEELDEVGTVLLGGEAKFGAGVISDDRKYLTSRAWLQVEDKYDFNQEIVKQYVQRQDLDTVFPLSLFVDNQEKIKSIQNKAKQWGKRTANSLDSFVTTKKVQATRKGITVGATSVLYTYELSVGTELPQVDKLGEVLDSVYRTKGCTVQLSAGDLLIALPLPKDFVTPIDTATMFIEAFWQVEVESV